MKSEAITEREMLAEINRLELEVDGLTEERAKLIEALIKLSNEAKGSSDMARECIGNTNANCLEQRADEARALIEELS